MENATRHQDKIHSPEEAPSRAHREGYRERPEDKRGLPRKSQSPVCAWNLLPGAPLLPPPRGKQPRCSSTHQSPDSTWSDRTMADHRATKSDASDTCYDTGAPLPDASSADENVTRGDRTGHGRPTPYVGPRSRRAFHTEKATHDEWICGHRGRGPRVGALGCAGLLPGVRTWFRNQTVAAAAHVGLRRDVQAKRQNFLTFKSQLRFLRQRKGDKAERQVQRVRRVLETHPRGEGPRPMGSGRGPGARSIRTVSDGLARPRPTTVGPCLAPGTDHPRGPPQHAAGGSWDPKDTGPRSDSAPSRRASRPRS